MLLSANCELPYTDTVTAIVVPLQTVIHLGEVVFALQQSFNTINFWAIE